MRFPTIFLLLVISLASCQPLSEEVKENPTPNKFFDLKGYIQQEIKRLEAAQPKVSKTVAVNDKTETKELSGLNYDRELEIFIQSDINRRDWFEKYRADSTFQNSQLTEIQYTAQKEDLRTRQLIIDFQNGKVSKIYIKNGGENMAAGSEQELTYQPDSGYHIESLQHTALVKDKRFRIEVQFLD